MYYNEFFVFAMQILWRHLIFSIFELNSSYGDEIEKVGSEKDVNSYLQESPEKILTRETTKREKAKNAIEEFKTWCLKYITVENFNLIFKC